MSLTNFLNNKEQSIQKQSFTNNEAIDGFCRRFFEKAGANYKNTLPNFIKLVFNNVGLIQEMLKSQEIKEIENMANTAVSKGMINTETINGFSNIINLFK